MWPFKKRKRWVILRLGDGGYYAGQQRVTDSVWTRSKDKAMRFTHTDAHSAIQSMIIQDMRHAPEHRMLGTRGSAVVEV